MEIIRLKFANYRSRKKTSDGRSAAAEALERARVTLMDDPSRSDRFSTSSYLARGALSQGRSYLDHGVPMIMNWPHLLSTSLSLSFLFLILLSLGSSRRYRILPVYR